MTRFRIRRRLKSLFKRARNSEIYPDEIFLDSHNIPQFDRSQMEGRIVRPISKFTLRALATLVFISGVVFTGRLFYLQVLQGASYEVKSENNHLKQSTIFADRGLIYDSKGVLLAWNEPNPKGDFALRVYTPLPGLAHLLGYVSYPKKDSSGNYYDKEVTPKDGVERTFDSELSGKAGVKIVEIDAKNAPQSESVVRAPQSGDNITLSIDAEMSSALYNFIKSIADDVGFVGGAGAVIDTRTGQLIALTSYPEYDSTIMTAGGPASVIAGYLADTRKPFLDRSTIGLYTPGSIIKPFIATGVLTEGVISPSKKLLSTGQISIPNPYDPTKETLFKDWRAQGYVDMRHAIAVSSDVYFYTVGGGVSAAVAPQVGLSSPLLGLGIANIEKYVRLFGFGTSTGLWAGEGRGTIPSPEWKAQNFPDDPTWRIGDTYHSAIGQYGFQVTLIQVVRAVAAIANEDNLLTPTVLAADIAPSTKLPISSDVFDVVHDGMRLSTLEGTASALNIPEIHISAKTGTAELGVSKEHVNSWVMGFFPSEHPRYAFAITMERGRRGNLVGASAVARSFFEWLYANRPEIVKP